ncbi:hypothetical protein NDU88_001510 [Pleurodeles waltl]|uniref:Uncharacterized protein n=1 Tax=Pleurodeles waltl TaxID=8319 RepID=A0AAV7LZI5_PLEWA|nr:hypothetical protein NDU88_001510 [Pleurodeles waltl]
MRLAPLTVWCRKDTPSSSVCLFTFLPPLGNCYSIGPAGCADERRRSRRGRRTPELTEILESKIHYVIRFFQPARWLVVSIIMKVFKLSQYGERQVEEGGNAETRK